MGTVNPLGKDLEEYWHGLIEGRSTARPAEGYPTEKLTTKFACEVPNFDPQDFMDRKVAQRIADRHGLIEGRSTARPAEGYPTEKLTTKFACEVPNFDPQDFMDRKVAQRMARFSQMAVAASTMALSDSGLDLAKEDSFRVGVDMGTGIGGFIEMTNGAISYATKT